MSAAQSLKTLENLIVTHGAALQKTDPARLNELKGLLAELKRPPTAKAFSPSAQRALKGLFLWQLDVRRAAYVQQLEAAEKSTPRDVGVAKSIATLKNLIAVVDEAKKSVTNGSGAAPVERAAERARTSLTELQKLEPTTRSAAKALGPTPKAPLAAARASTNGGQGRPSGPVPAQAAANRPSRGSGEFGAPTWLASKLDASKLSKKK